MESHPLETASAAFRAGRLEEAAGLCHAILARDPWQTETNHLLGVILYRQGRGEAARDTLARAVASPRATAEMFNNYGAVLNALGDSDRAAAAYERAIALQPDFAQAFNNLGVAHLRAKRTAAAIAAFKRALVLQPDFAEANRNLRSAYNDVIPAWHFAMLDDTRRNDAYAAAIARAASGKRVLDIGTGTGLLAMLAARAGAKSVVSCEAVEVIAELARDIVAKNGFAGRIAVVAKDSSQMAVGKDIPERAEVLVTEVFSSGFTNEGVLATLEHAHAHLLTPGATVIPAGGRVVGYLAGGAVLENMLFAGKTKGFDLSPFDNLAPSEIDIALDGFPHEVLSQDIEIFRFDFRQGRFPALEHPLEVTATRAGVCAGLAQWIALELDADTTYENRPARQAGLGGHWMHMLYRFPEPLRVAEGDRIRLIARHDRIKIAVDFVEHLKAGAV